MAKSNTMAGALNVVQNVKTKTKILVGTGVPIAMLLLLGAVTIYSIDSIFYTNKWGRPHQ